MSLTETITETISERSVREPGQNPSTANDVTTRAKDANTGSDFLSLAKQATVLAFVGIVALAAVKVATGKYYTPRSDVGFYLGVVGAVMILAMLSYPMRKRIRFMHRWGALRHWFRWHMIMGIVGPTLVLFHSTFHLRSLNATIALTSMLIVVVSGVIGRFVYTRIHHGLYGSRATLERVRQDFESHSKDLRSCFRMVPHVEERLKTYVHEAAQVEPSFPTMWWRFFTLGWKRRICVFRCAKELRSAIQQERYLEFPGGVQGAIRLVEYYLQEAERVAEFTAYERLFSFWHVLHIPLIFLLAASSIFHIIAAYMY